MNNQMVVGTLMNICDNPNRVSIGQVGYPPWRVLARALDDSSCVLAWSWAGLGLGLVQPAELQLGTVG